MARPKQQNKSAGARAVADTGVETRRERIIEAAAEAFMTDGFAATTVDRVADILGCTKGLIYYEFKNKTDLFLEIHKVAMVANFGVVEPISQEPISPTDRLAKMVLAHISAITDRLPYQRVSVMGIEMQLSGATTPEQRKVLDEIVQMHRDYEQVFISVLEEGMATGEFRSGDARRRVKPLLGALNWMPMWYRPKHHGGQAGKKAIVEEMLGFVLHGVARNMA
ncbi:MAG: TetR/AcrR family transcriptional regulator [Alphaproteobacteria bacterium]|nr:TetR/AcrR family transcriptional regulator [Alphaproteobacteria bacterium]